MSSNFNNGGELVVTSTTDLTPAGIAGYAKAVAAFLSGLIVVVAPFVTEPEVAKWFQIVAAVAGFVAVYGLPNKVVPTTVLDGPDDVV